MTFTVDSDRPLAVSTRAQIRYRNLVGQRYVALTRGRRVGPRCSPARHHPAAADPAGAGPHRAVQRLQAAVRGAEPAGRQRVRVGDHQDAAGRGRRRELAARPHRVADHRRWPTATRSSAGPSTTSTRCSAPSTSAASSCPRCIAELQRFVSGLAADREAIGASLTNIANLADATAGLLKDGRPAIRGRRQASSARSAGTLDDNKKVVDGVLQRLPNKLDTHHPDRHLRLLVQLLPLRLRGPRDPVQHGHVHPELPLVGGEVQLMLRKVPGRRGGRRRSASATRSSSARSAWP